ncbi:E3 ubiquitin-protein ligase rnf146-like [Temnothorax americanus]|uniref:E3 ubiquitin-protein ligase rnf146-like n=1 Tax=Temnothorax americanus TaxID=1964332 RepID=UPI0040677C3C
MANILNIGGEPIFDDSVVKIKTHTYNPYANTTFGHNDEIRIPIQQQDLYTLPCESFLYVEGRLVIKRRNECAVCLQPCIHPARLPCSHIYCYLCVKGVANQSKRCPMCPQEISPDFLERPQLVEVEEPQKESEHPKEEYQWFYESRNSWWKYDPRTSNDLETIYKLGDAQCKLLICGMLYVIDFKKKCQYRKYNPRYKRNIKRDKKDAPCKGVSGVQ